MADSHVSGLVAPTLNLQPRSPSKLMVPEQVLPYGAVAAVIPALDEEGSIVPVIQHLLTAGVALVVVADNGSTDATAAVARAAGAIVVPATPRGYGSACLAALRYVSEVRSGLDHHDLRAVVFCDADGADDMKKLPTLCQPVIAGEVDLMVGSRVLGQAAPGALSAPQIAGNLVAALLLRILFRQRVTDLGPFRCISTAALERIAMRDQAFGWTAEMQTKVLRLGLRYRELAVDAKLRTAGHSKISGRFIPIFRAGWAIITTILRYRFSALPASQSTTHLSPHAANPT